MAKHNYVQKQDIPDERTVTKLGAVIWKERRYRALILTYLRAESKRMGNKSIRELPQSMLDDVGATISPRGLMTISFDVEIPDAHIARQRVLRIKAFRKEHPEHFNIPPFKKTGGKRTSFACFRKKGMGAEFSDGRCMDENLMDVVGQNVDTKKTF